MGEGGGERGERRRKAEFLLSPFPLLHSPFPLKAIRILEVLYRACRLRLILSTASEFAAGPLTARGPQSHVLVAAMRRGAWRRCCLACQDRTAMTVSG